MKDIYSDYYLWILFSQTLDVIIKARERELQTHHISESHARILFIIELIGHNATPAKISRWLMREPQSITEIIDRMEKQGLLKKIKDLDRKNQVRIEVTEKGHKVYERSFIPKNIPEILSVLTESDRKRLTTYLMKLRKAGIEHVGIKYHVPLPPIE